MSNHFVPRVGAVFSADIAVPEHEREVRFYARVLSTGDKPLWREADLMNNLGMPIIGLGEMSPAYATLPLQWMPHIQVADVAASVQRAVESGGSTLMNDEGNQWAVLLDPNGAAFGIVPVPAEREAHTDAASSDMPVGRIAWLDLTVPDASTTRDFYSQVIGWSVHDVEMKDADTTYADYGMVRPDGSPAAGVCHARGVNVGLPPVWMIYLLVGDLEESIRRVEPEGGKVLKTMSGQDGKQIYAAIQDPVGACFALMQG